MGKNIIEHVWSVVCSSSSVDRETNNISLFNLIEKLTFNIPTTVLEKVKREEKRSIAFPIEFEVVSRFRRSEAKEGFAFDYRLRVLNAESRIIFAGQEQKIALKEGIDNIRIRNQFKNIPIQKTGIYKIVIEIRNVGETTFRSVYSIPLDIVVKEESQ